MEVEFEEFRKIARLNREIVITEKIDGCNGQIFIEDDGTTMHVGSRNRWLSGEKGQDNHGFYVWCQQRKDELLKLGPGRHYGEFYGSKIQCGYGLLNGEKRFALFNTSIWNKDTLPVGIDVVPTLYRGLFKTDVIDYWIENLRVMGSYAVPGFMNPEGVIIYHIHANQYFKVTLKNDELPKSLVPA